MSAFWSAFVIVITVAMMAACLWLLVGNSRGVPGEVKDHVWDDDLREYNNPLPRWWFNVFILTLVFGVAYLVFYPGLGNLGGRLGWTSAQQMQADLDELTAKRQAVYAQLKDLDIPALARDSSALALGQAVFVNNCAGCHGADARGALGFPNLADDDWLFGGTPEAIVATITHGRLNQMPGFSAALQQEQLQALLDFVPYWSDPDLAADRRARGMAQFAITCAGCHGADGKGNPMLGAPNLSDDVWLYGGGRERVRESIVSGRQARMPANDTFLTPEEIRVVAAYVFGLARGAPADSGP